MQPYFRETMELLRQSAMLMQESSDKTRQAFTSLTSAVDSVIHANNEHEDIRLTVERLEKLVLDLTEEVRKLKS